MKGRPLKPGTLNRIDAAGFERGEVTHATFVGPAAPIVSILTDGDDVIDSRRIRSLGSCALVDA